jgi:uncharacterized protein (UPF0297 family)
MTENTVKFDTQADKTLKVKKIIEEVYAALKEKGYNPASQIVGYLMSDDPTYITSHKNARGVISRVERDEIMEVLVKEFLAGLEG